MPEIDALLNKGFVVRQPAETGDGDREPSRGPGRTIIVTGLRRSGTSLVAAMLREAGIFMGSEINDIVHEDEQIAGVMISGDVDALQRIIRDRDADYLTWGFKLPMLSDSIGPDQIALFNNPHLIVPFRDPLAVSARNAMSDYQEPMQALRNSVRELDALITFIEQLACPVLLLSYEKMLAFPSDQVDAITGFSGIPHNDALRNRLVALVEPNRPAYIAVARRRYEGIVEGIAGAHLRGWCQLTKSDEPVSLELFIDGALVRSFVADTFRPDLVAAGFGNGRHGFSVDLGGLDLNEDAVISIKVAQHGVELDNSNRPVREYRHRTA
jgi:hypothetical protein